MLAQKLGVTPEYLETGSTSARPICASCGSPSRSCGCGSTASSIARDGRRAPGRRRAPARTSQRRRARGSCSGSAPRRPRRPRRGDRAPLGGDRLRARHAASRPDVYSTLGRAYAASGRRRDAVALFEQALRGARPRPSRENAAARDPLQHLSELRADRPRRAAAREGRRRGAVRARAGRRRPVHAGAAPLVARAALARAGTAAARRSTASGAPSRCSRRPRTPCTSRARTSPAPTPRSRRRRRRAARSASRGRRAAARAAPGGDDLAALRRLQAMCATPRATPTARRHSGARRSLLAGRAPERARERLVGDRAEARAGADGDPDEAFREALDPARRARDGARARERAPRLRPVPARDRPRARGARRLRARRRRRVEPPGRPDPSRPLRRPSATSAGRRARVPRC